MLFLGEGPCFFTSHFLLNMSYPIIIGAPHAQTSIDDPAIRDRISLTDYELWKCSDPFTGELDEFTVAREKHVATTHRLICDLNRPPDLENAFHEKDFFGRSVFYRGKKFTTREKKSFLKKHWKSYHDKIAKSVKALDKENPPLILLVDYHNTSGDHTLDNRGAYMPSIVVSNLGKFQRIDHLEKEEQLVSLPDEILAFFAKDLEERLPLGVEMNDIFHGGYNLRWYQSLPSLLKLKSPVFAVQFEYNLDLVVNPLTRNIDYAALRIMQEKINESLEQLYLALERYLEEGAACDTVVFENSLIG